MTRKILISIIIFLSLILMTMIFIYFCSPNETEILFKKASLIEKQEGMNKALPIYEKILEQYPDTKIAGEAQEKILAFKKEEERKRIQAEKIASFKLTKSQAKNLVTKNCKYIRNKASFVISSRCKFSIINLKTYGEGYYKVSNITVKSVGFWYDIVFTAIYGLSYNDEGVYIPKLLEVKEGRFTGLINSAKHFLSQNSTREKNSDDKNTKAISSSTTAAVPQIKDKAVLAIGKSNDSPQNKINRLKKMALDGNAEAALLMGVIYQKGLNGAPVNQVQSSEWYLLAAEKGNPYAQFMIAANYAAGIGVKKSLSKALEWYKKSAQQGIQEAKKAVKDFEQYKWLLKTGWVSIKELCESGIVDCSKPFLVTSNSFINHWAGEVIEAYLVEGDDTFRRLKIKVSWITDRSPYNCGQIIILESTQVKDFTARSFALKPCR